MSPVLFVLIVPIVFVVLIAIRIPFMIRAERRAHKEAEQRFAGDPAGLQAWRDERAVRRMLMRRQIQGMNNLNPPN